MGYRKRRVTGDVEKNSKEDSVITKEEFAKYRYYVRECILVSERLLAAHACVCDVMEPYEPYICNSHKDLKELEDLHKMLGADHA